MEPAAPAVAPPRPRRVRPVFLVALLVAVLALVVQRTLFPPFEAPVWNGTTTQGELFQLAWIGESLDGLYTRVELGCSDGTERVTDWKPRDGVETSFVRSGGEVGAAETSEERTADGQRLRMTIRMQGRVGDERARGVVRATWRYARGAFAGTTCDSGDVGWSVAR